LCEQLIDQGERVTLATLDWAPQSAPPPFLRRFPLGLAPRRLGSSPSMKQWLREQAQGQSVDIIHVHGLWMMPSVYPGHVARKYDVPVMVAPRGTLSRYAFRSGSVAKRVFWPLMQRPALQAMACFHATAEAEYHDIRRMGFRQPVAVIPNAIDIPAYERPHAGERRTVLYLGRLHPEKGIETLLSAWKRVFPRFRDWQLRLVGPNIGGYLDRVTGIAATLGVQRVTFAGPLYGKDKQDAYRGAHLYILPSPSENFGVSVAEALAAGTPAIATKGAPWEGLVRKRAGWWVEADAASLANALEDALTLSDADLTQMGLRGRSWMQEEFSWPEVANKTMAAYRWMLDRGRCPDCVVEE
jgi:glycosyltransferase involved in cell wall biosynthesis